MRSFLFLCCIVITIQSSAQSEKQEQRKLKFGISGGINFSRTPAISYIDITPSYKNYRKSKFAIGAAAKLTMEYKTSQHFSLQPEVGFGYYHQKQVYSTSPVNARISYGHDDDLYVTSVTLGNMFKYSTKYFSVLTGPQVDFPMSAKITSLWKSESSLTDIHEEIYKVDLKKEKKLSGAAFNWIFGLEHKVIENLAIQVSYQLGLSKYTETHINWKIDKISGLYIGAAYQF